MLAKSPSGLREPGRKDMSYSPVVITLLSFIGVNVALVGCFFVNRLIERLSRVEA